jgi:hypothetical protein
MQRQHLQTTTMSLRIVALIILIIAPSFLVADIASQAPTGLQPGFNKAILDVRSVEAAGGTPSEIASLVETLNRALELNEQALRLTDPPSAGQRAQLLAQVDQMLLKVEDNARQLQVVASERTNVNGIVAYVAGGVAALLGTFAYALCLSFWRRYRVKRTLQMKITPK